MLLRRPSLDLSFRFTLRRVPEFPPADPDTVEIEVLRLVFVLLLLLELVELLLCRNPGWVCSSSTC